MQHSHLENHCQTRKVETMSCSPVELFLSEQHRAWRVSRFAATGPSLSFNKDFVPAAVARTGNASKADVRLVRLRRKRPHRLHVQGHSLWQQMYSWTRCRVATCGRAAGGTCRRVAKHLGTCQPQKQLVSWPLPCSGAATLWFWRLRATRGAQRPSAAKSGSSLFQPPLTSVRMAATYEKFHETHDII